MNIKEVKHIAEFVRQYIVPGIRVMLAKEIGRITSMESNVQFLKKSQEQNLKEIKDLKARLEVLEAMPSSEVLKHLLKD